MTPMEQLQLWIQGVYVHNDNDECCPDFACCSKTNHFSTELRIKFLETYKSGGSEACMPMLMMALSGLLVDHNDIPVYVAGMQTT